MTVAEIVILIVGALLFTISFFIPDKSGDRTEDIESLLSSDAARDAITGALDGEINRAKGDLRKQLLWFIAEYIPQIMQNILI